MDGYQCNETAPRLTPCRDFFAGRTHLEKQQLACIFRRSRRWVYAWTGRDEPPVEREKDLSKWLKTGLGNLEHPAVIELGKIVAKRQRFTTE